MLLSILIFKLNGGADLTVNDDLVYIGRISNPLTPVTISLPFDKLRPIILPVCYLFFVKQYYSLKYHNKQQYNYYLFLL